MLGEVEEAERLLIEGMQAAPNNANLKGAYWMLLVVSKRFEEAERVVHEMRADYGDTAPDMIKRRFDFQLGMLAMIRRDFAAAREHLTSAISEEENPAWSGDEIMILTLASLALDQTGKSEESATLLSDAQRMIRRARLNGVDDPNIYYSEGIVLTLLNEPDAALQKLQQAYEKGFRESWVLDIDGRLDPLRDRPEFLLFKDQINNDVTRGLAEIRSLSLAAL